MYRAGRTGNKLAESYGYDPDCDNSGHFNRHVRSALKDVYAMRRLLYTLRMPGSSAKATGRVEHTVHVMCPHEQVDGNMRETME